MSNPPNPIPNLNLSSIASISLFYDVKSKFYSIFTLVLDTWDQGNLFNRIWCPHYLVSVDRLACNIEHLFNVQTQLLTACFAANEHQNATLSTREQIVNDLKLGRVVVLLFIFWYASYNVCGNCGYTSIILQSTKRSVFNTEICITYLHPNS